jgi:pilus assembly protein Flp/PilA
MAQWEERKQNMNKVREARAQGLVEYAMIILLVALIVIIVLVLLAPPIANIYSNIITNL